MSFKNNKLNESEIISNLKASWSKNASTLFYMLMHMQLCMHRSTDNAKCISNYAFAITL